MMVLGYASQLTHILPSHGKSINIRYVSHHLKYNFGSFWLWRTQIQMRFNIATQLRLNE